MVRRPMPGRAKMVSIDHHAANEASDLDADQGDDGDKSVLQGMAEDYYVFRQALRPSGADVILAQHLEQRRARHAHGYRRQLKAEDQRRQRHSSQVPLRSLPKRDVDQRRNPARYKGKAAAPLWPARIPAPIPSSATACTMLPTIREQQKCRLRVTSPFLDRLSGKRSAAEARSARNRCHS